MPEPLGPVHQVKTAFVPATPLAVMVVNEPTQIGLAVAVAEVMLTLVLTVTEYGHEAEWPLASVAVQVMVVNPGLKATPLSEVPVPVVAPASE